MADDYSVLLKLLLDRDSAELTKKELKKVTSLAKEADRAFKGEGVVHFSKYIKATKDAEKATNSFRREQKQLQREAKATKQVIKDLSDLQAFYAKQATIASRTAGMLNSFGNKAVAGGLLIGGGIIAEAAAYAVKVGDATEGTRQFNAELKKIESAKGRIDEVLVGAVLPLLQTASKVASITAGILERNPQLASLALKGAALLVAVGTLAKIAGTGFKIYADVTYFTAQGIGLEAARLQLLASENQLLAAGGKGIGGKVATVASGIPFKPIIGTALAATVLGTGLAVEAEILKKKFFELSGASKETASIINTVMEAVENTVPLLAIGNSVIALGKVFGYDLPAMAEKAVTGVSAVSGAVEGLASVAEDEATALKMMKSLAEDNAKAERKYADDREGILTDASRSLADSNRSLARNLGEISSSLASNIAKINRDLKGDLAKLAADFAEASTKADAEYQKKRAEIVASGESEIQKIREQAQKDLENLERDHSHTLEDLTANRDALGIVLENRAFAEKQADIQKNADESIEQARENTQKQLAEAAQHYAEERAQRLAEFEKQKEEAKVRAAEAIAEAKANAEEARKKAIAANAEEKAAIERKRLEALADLKKAYDRERKERVTAVYNEIKELRGALNAELLMRRTYQNQILTEATANMQKLVKIFSMKTVSNPVIGGVSTGAGGIPGANRAAERMAGGKFNDQALLGGLGGGTNYTDNGTYSGVTVADMKRIRQMNRRDNLQTLSAVFRR